MGRRGELSTPFTLMDLLTNLTYQKAPFITKDH